MKYYLKNILFVIVYMFMTMLTALGISCIGNDLTWLKILLSFLNLGLFGVVVFLMFYTEGQTARKVMHSNDLSRKVIVETGEDMPIKVHEEYSCLKGYAFGFFASVPLIICLIVHLILILALGESYIGGGVIAGLLYKPFFDVYEYFIWLGTGQMKVIYWHYFILIYAVPCISCLTGIAYNLGAKKIQKQYDKINAQQEMIYGKKKK